MQKCFRGSTAVVEIPVCTSLLQASGQFLLKIISLVGHLFMNNLYYYNILE